MQCSEPTSPLYIYIYISWITTPDRPPATGLQPSLQPASVPRVARDEKELNAELKTHVTMYATADRYDISLSAILYTPHCSLVTLCVEAGTKKPRHPCTER